MRVKRKHYDPAIFSTAPQASASNGLTPAQQFLVLDWRAVRAELRRLRDVNELTREALQKLSGVEKTTIYRIENTKELPDYKPDFETIEALLRAMEVSLSAFFLRIEGLPPTRQTDPESAHSTPSAGAGDDRALSATERSADALVQRTFIAALAQEIAVAVDRLIEARTQNRATRKPSSTTVRGRGKTRRSTAR